MAVGLTTLVSFVGNVLSISIIYISSYAFHISKIYIDPQILLIFGIGSAVGALLGAKLTPKINRKVLTIVLAAMAIIAGIYLLTQLF
ncbi:TSUP family transporter [Acetobacterium paludosum]|uniref:Probable membrane transporter protein n=1 Tax=Acetobacterium paludosum TaxID=52693 RepID=A0A923I3R6_9FIRM|nr:TSUP family transporter [Acetobacterium paludosum]